MKNIVVLISGGGSNLQVLIDAVANGDIAANILAVISNKKDAYGLVRAKKAGIKTIVVESNKAMSREEYDAKLLDFVDPLGADLIVLSGFMRILTAQFVNYYHQKMLNIHPSLLPLYKGLHTHQKAIDNGDKYHGASVHFVTPKLDDGPVVLQAKVAVLKNDNAETLAKRVLKQEHIIYPKAISWFCEERLKFKNNGLYLDAKELLEPKVIYTSNKP